MTTHEELVSTNVVAWEADDMDRETLEQCVLRVVREACDAAVAVEREICAEIAENLQIVAGTEILRMVSEDHEEAGRAIAVAIRARSTT